MQANIFIGLGGKGINCITGAYQHLLDNEILNRCRFLAIDSNAVELQTFPKSVCEHPQGFWGLGSYPR